MVPAYCESSPERGCGVATDLQDSQVFRSRTFGTGTCREKKWGGSVGCGLSWGNLLFKKVRYHAPFLIPDPSRVRSSLLFGIPGRSSVFNHSVGEFFFLVDSVRRSFFLWVFASLLFVSFLFACFPGDPPTSLHAHFRHTILVAYLTSLGKPLMVTIMGTSQRLE